MKRSNPSSVRNHRITHRQTHRRTKTKRRTALTAAGVALGVGMAATGTTYALWHASTTIGGGTITAGNLALTSQGTPAYWDVSADRTDANQHINPLPDSPVGHSIDLAQWRMVPGDKIALTQRAKVELDGDNLTAALAVAGLDQAKSLPIKWTYTVNEATTGVAIAAGAVPTTTPSADLAYFTATAGSTDLTLWPVNSGEALLEVVIYAELPASVTGTDYARVNQALQGLTLDLNQVRGTNK